MRGRQTEGWGPQGRRDSTCRAQPGLSGSPHTVSLAPRAQLCLCFTKSAHTTVIQFPSCHFVGERAGSGVGVGTETVPVPHSYSVPGRQHRSSSSGSQTSGRRPPLGARTSRKRGNTQHCQHCPLILRSVQTHMQTRQRQEHFQRRTWLSGGQPLGSAVHIPSLLWA